MVKGRGNLRECTWKAVGGAPVRFPGWLDDRPLRAAQIDAGRRSYGRNGIGRTKLLRQSSPILPVLCF